MLEAKWISRFMKLAAEVATWSKDSTQVGCVISEEKEVRGMGYNGPAHYKDDARIFESVHKNNFIIHAEDNALARCGHVHNGSIFITKPPCMDCARKIVSAKYNSANICHLFCPPAATASKWYDSQLEALSYLENNGIQVHFVTV